MAEIGKREIWKFQLARVFSSQSLAPETMTIFGEKRLDQLARLTLYDAISPLVLIQCLKKSGGLLVDLSRVCGHHNKQISEKSELFSADLPST